MDVTLPPRLAAFVRAQVDTGLYRSSGEVVEEALRRLLEQHEAREARRAALRLALRRGEDSPLVEDYSIEALIAETDLPDQR